MTRGETRKILWGTDGRRVVAIVVASLAIAGAFWVGAFSSTGASRQSASWVSGPAPGGADDRAVPMVDSGAAPEQA